MTMHPFHFLISRPPNHISCGNIWINDVRHTIYYDLDCDRTRTEDLAKHLLTNPYQAKEEILSLLNEPAIDPNARVVPYLGDYEHAIPLLHFAAIMAPPDVVKKFQKNPKIDMNAQAEGYSALRALAHFMDAREQKNLTKAPLRETAQVLQILIGDARLPLLDSSLNLSNTNTKDSTDAHELLNVLAGKNANLFAYATRLLSERARIVAHRNFGLAQSIFLDLFQTYKNTDDDFSLSIFNTETKREETRPLSEHIYLGSLNLFKTFLNAQIEPNSPFQMHNLTFWHLAETPFLTKNRSTAAVAIDRREILHTSYMLATHFLSKRLDKYVQNNHLTPAKAEDLFTRGVKRIKSFAAAMQSDAPSALHDKIITYVRTPTTGKAAKSLPYRRKDFQSAFHNQTIRFVTTTTITDGPS